MRRVITKQIFTTWWVRADMVSCRGGRGNTEKTSNQIGVRDGFLEKVLVACLSAYVSICHFFHFSPLAPIHVSICLTHRCHLSTYPVSIYQPSAYLFVSWRICSLSNCWPIGHLSVSLSIGWSLLSCISPVLHYLSDNLSGGLCSN